MQEFAELFATRLEDAEFKGVVRINWNIGGLHFSQTQKVFSRIGSKNDFITVSDTHTNKHKHTRTHTYTYISLVPSS